MIVQILSALLGTHEEHDETGLSKTIVTRSTDPMDGMQLLYEWSRKMQKVDPIREIANERRMYGDRLKQEWREKWMHQPAHLLSLPGTQLSLRF